MLGFSISEMLDTVEEALQGVSTPILQYAREKYPHLSILGTVALCVVIGFGVYRSHKIKAKEKIARKEDKVNAIENRFETLSGIAAKQAELFEKQLVLVRNIRQKLDKPADDVPVKVLNSAEQSQARSGSELIEQLPESRPRP